MPANLIIRHPRVPSRLAARLRRVGARLLDRCGVTGHTVNFVLVDDEEMARLNHHYRQRPGPTNVLSFPFNDGAEPLPSLLSLNEMGDVVISLDTAATEAAADRQTIEFKLAWLMSHGLLHLLGYDHEISETEALRMSTQEQLLLDDISSMRRHHMTHLAVNVDHVATIRQARGITEPDPVTAAAICELAGARGIVVHLREDRRHIQDRDVKLLRETVQTKLNLEMGAAREIISFALAIKPDMVTLVPEKRQELTTEGGLDVVAQKKKLAKTIEKMTQAGVPVSLFIDPSEEQVKAAYHIGATFVEIHTGAYAEAGDDSARRQQFALIEAAATEALQHGLRVNAGHGLNYQNTAAVAALDTIEELSIGHAIISRAVFTGLDRAVREMHDIIYKASLF